MENNHPNFLLVDLEDQDGQLLTVAGFRIRMVDYSQRAEELEFVVNKAKEKKHPVLMIADCNNLRRETTEASWNLQVVDHILSQVDSRDTRHAVKASLRNTQTEDMHMNLQKII